MEHQDVLIIGAGLSGIGAAVQLQRDCPGSSFCVLESRECLGGTWDLVPGVRSGAVLTARIPAADGAQSPPFVIETPTG